MNEESDPEEFSDNENDEQTSVDDLEHILENQSPESDSEVNIGKVWVSEGQLCIVAPKPAPTKAPVRSHTSKGTKRQVIVKEHSGSDDDTPGELLVVPSSWPH